MNQLTTALMLAVTIEALTEYIKMTVDALTRKKYRAVAICGLSVAVSVTISILANADLFSAVGVDFIHPVIGKILTGIFASRGANYLNSLVGRMCASLPQENPATGGASDEIDVPALDAAAALLDLPGPDAPANQPAAPTPDDGANPPDGPTAIG